MIMPILSWIVFLPLLGMVVVILVPRGGDRFIRAVSTLVTAAVLVLSLKLLFSFHAASPDMQFVERMLWIPQLNVHYHLGIDGISLPMVFATALLSFLACIASFGIKDRAKEYFALYLLLA